MSSQNENCWEDSIAAVKPVACIEVCSYNGVRVSKLKARKPQNEQGDERVVFQEIRRENHADNIDAFILGEPRVGCSHAEDLVYQSFVLWRPERLCLG